MRRRVAITRLVAVPTLAAFCAAACAPAGEPAVNRGEQPVETRTAAFTQQDLLDAVKQMTSIAVKHALAKAKLESYQDVVALLLSVFYSATGIFQASARSASTNLSP